MVFQEIIILILFAFALLYMGKLFYKSFTSKKECGNNCKCGVDFSEIKLPDSK